MTIVVEPFPVTQHLAQQLLRRAEELGAVLRSACRPGPGMHHEVLDFKDLAAEDRQALLDAVAFGQAAEELGQVRTAQQRLAAGSYGTCADCGEPIPARRLQALPATPFCTDCQALRERPTVPRR